MWNFQTKNTSSTTFALVLKGIYQLHDFLPIIPLLLSVCFAPVHTLYLFLYNIYLT